MKKLLLCVLVLTGLNAMAKTVEHQCQVKNIDLSNTDWGSVSPRIDLDCGSSYFTNTYIDFHYSDASVTKNILSNIHIGDSLTLEVTLDESLMYHYPDFITKITSADGDSQTIDRKQSLMFVQK